MENERLTRAAAAQGAENLAKLKDLNVLIIGCTGNPISPFNPHVLAPSRSLLARRAFRWGM